MKDIKRVAALTCVNGKFCIQLAELRDVDAGRTVVSLPTEPFVGLFVPNTVTRT